MLHNARVPLSSPRRARFVSGLDQLRSVRAGGKEGECRRPTRILERFNIQTFTSLGVHMIAEGYRGRSDESRTDLDPMTTGIRVYAKHVEKRHNKTS